MKDLPFNLTDVDFLQEGLDFSEITPVDFENLIFHLIDEMGFSNIQWRKGGDGNSATDGGRDLEATFWSVQPAVSKEEKYWFEVKFRSGQLEKSQVQGTILNASGNTKKDNVVIVTNKTISNPTLDWVNDFQKDHKSPVVTVWQGHDLEVLLRKNPRTLARFLPSSLAFSGRCKVIESRFSNLMLLPSGSELDELWEKRNQYYENSYLTLAACIAEAAFGDVTKNTWGMELEGERLLSACATGMINVYPFIFKCSSLNRDQTPLIIGLSYLIQCLLIRYGAETTSVVLFEPEQLFDLEYELPGELKANRYEPIFNTIFHDLAVNCSAKYCPKMHHASPDENVDYFQRYIESGKQKENDGRYLVFNSNKEECKIGLVAREDFCPLGTTDEELPKSLDILKQKLEFARSVILIRTNELREDA